MSDRQYSERIWFDLFEVIDDPAFIEAKWQYEIERYLDSYTPLGKFEVFCLAAVQVYKHIPGSARATLDTIVTRSGYSRATFFRLFRTLPDFQLRAYQFLGNAALHVFEAKLKLAELAPEAFSRLAISILYSSHMAMPQSAFNELREAHPQLEHTAFNNYLERSALIISEYVKRNAYMGYREVSFDELYQVVRLLDYDIWLARSDKALTFPSKEQAQRLESMFLGFISGSPKSIKEPGETPGSRNLS